MSRNRMPLMLSIDAESKPLFRADTDQGGDWYVWRRVSANGWATYQRCDTREDACRAAASLNGHAQAS
ncbi:MAG: hypothetical protein KDA28_12015 [Phycisphaerales bacterium]|nr:hypothetical protein [Phycisphaerales bacterium]